jgi:hypothetical protein
MTEYNGLLTLTQVATWDPSPSIELERIARTVQEVDEKIAIGSRWLELAQKEHAEKDFIRRLFSSRKAEKHLTRFLHDHNIYKAKLQELASQLQAINFTPKEQKKLWKELQRARRNCKLKSPK